MRSAIEETKRRHPSWASTPQRDRSEEGAPYRRFIDALEDFSLNVSLHGSSSLEVAEARANVKRRRELAADAWRRSRTAA